MLDSCLVHPHSSQPGGSRPSSLLSQNWEDQVPTHPGVSQHLETSERAGRMRVSLGDFIHKTYFNPDTWDTLAFRIWRSEDVACASVPPRVIKEAHQLEGP